MNGIYDARGWVEEENDSALLVVRLGAPSLLNVLHIDTGLLGLTYTRKLASKVIDSRSDEAMYSFNLLPHFLTRSSCHAVAWHLPPPCCSYSSLHVHPPSDGFSSCAAGRRRSVKRALIANIKMFRQEVKNLPLTMWKVGIETDTVTRSTTAYVLGLAPPLL